MARKKQPEPFTPQEEYYMRREFARSLRGGAFSAEDFAKCEKLYKRNPEAYGRIHMEVKTGIIEEIRGSFG